jgi:hypothetical protein
LASTAWALAFVVTPALHLAHHRDDHVHLPGGAIAYTNHHHDDDDDDDDDDHDHSDHHDGSPLDHGSGALAHFGTASLDAPGSISLTAPQLVFAIEERIPPDRAIVSSPHLAIILARGPPPA